jgi:flagella basal body P-ring formation protein FlgA
MMMNNKAINILVTAFLLVTAQLCRASADSKNNGTEKAPALNIYLPREVTVKDDTISLDQVGVIRGEESLVEKAGRIALGQLSVPGQEIVIDRSIILSRLACSQIPPSQVILTGAEKVTVKQQQQVIEGSKFVEMALSFLQKNTIADPNCQLSPVRIPKDLVVPSPVEDVNFSMRTATSTKNQAKVQITVLVNGQEAGVREVTFRLLYYCRTAVTLVDIQTGTLISPENVKIEKTLSDCPEPSDWTAPYGLIAARRLPAQTVICSHMVGPVKPAVILERNQTVVVRVAKPGLLLTTTGKALQKGRVGDYIKVKVQITNTPRTITAKVNEDGSVEPVF